MSLSIIYRIFNWFIFIFINFGRLFFLYFFHIMLLLFFCMFFQFRAFLFRLNGTPLITIFILILFIVHIFLFVYNEIGRHFLLDKLFVLTFSHFCLRLLILYYFLFFFFNYFMLFLFIYWLFFMYFLLFFLNYTFIIKN